MTREVSYLEISLLWMSFELGIRVIIRQFVTSEPWSDVFGIWNSASQILRSWKTRWSPPGRNRLDDDGAVSWDALEDNFTPTRNSILQIVRKPVTILSKMFQSRSRGANEAMRLEESAPYELIPMGRDGNYYDQLPG